MAAGSVPVNGLEKPPPYHVFEDVAPMAAEESGVIGSTRKSFFGCSRGIVIDYTELFNEKLRECEDFYDYRRPHFALAGMTPYNRFRERAGLHA